MFRWPDIFCIIIFIFFWENHRKTNAPPTPTISGITKLIRDQFYNFIFISMKNNLFPFVLITTVEPGEEKSRGKGVCIALIEIFLLPDVSLK